MFSDDCRQQYANPVAWNVGWQEGWSAIKCGYIRHDPTKGVELPPIVHRNIQPPTPEQVWKLIYTAQALSMTSKSAQVGHPTIYVDTFSGLRRGEILALWYADIDWFAREIVVSKAVSKVKADAESTNGPGSWVRLRTTELAG